MESIEKIVAKQLLDIKAVKLNVENPFTWASGWKSPIYCDNRKVLSYPAARKVVYEAFVEIIKNRFKDVDVIAGVATGAIPSDFVRFGMVDDAIGGFGTILQVHSAEISESGEYVTLALTSTTNEFEGFINWGSPINSASWTNSGKVEYVQLSPNYILQPMIKRYVENTKITLVPGSVMVMGGLKEAKHVRFEDKVPVIGDLPLVGRLFRSEGEQKIRKALIYFVKVDVVDPTGRDVRTGERPSSVSDNF